jgi:broad specificity phosphatase PhoE
VTERTVVHLLRHGEVHNPNGVLYGRLPDYHLSEAGRAMAEVAARAVAGRDVVLVVASPLERAQETAGPIAAEFGLEIVTDPRLIEAGNIFEGLTYGVGDGSMRRPTHWKHLRNPLTPSWGEPYQEIADRMLAAVHDARDKAAGHEAVMVSHQLPIWTVRRFVEGRRLPHRPDRRQCGLASLTSLEYEGDRLVSVAYTEPAGEASRKHVTPGA